MRTPKVSIIILNWNKLEYLKNCIDSIEKLTAYPAYEIVVLDNASTEPGTAEYIDALEHTVIRNGENAGFARGNNKAAGSAGGELLLFLNNDTVVHRNWLKPMVDLMLNTKDCGIVGSKLLYPDGTIQHIGVMFDHRGNHRHLYKKYPAGIPEALKVSEREAVTGACLLIRKDLFNRVGGFDAEYLQGCEDIDLCLKVRDLGLKVMYCPESVVTHHEQVSAKDKGEGFKKKTTKRNLKHFNSRWKERLNEFRLIGNLSALKPYHYYQGGRDCIARLVPTRAKFILDVGCASGMLGRALKEEDPERRVWGIEVNELSAQDARKNLDRVLVANIEKEEVLFDEPVLFDCIILADVLEHMVDPWLVLNRLRRHLAPQGVIICSIPNVMHYKVIKDLVRNRWLYRDEGILDIDHLRFFSLATIENLLSVAGYRIERMERNKKASGFMTFANTLFFGRLENYLTQQYLLVCRSRSDKRPDKEIKG